MLFQFFMGNIELSHIYLAVCQNENDFVELSKCEYLFNMQDFFSEKWSMFFEKISWENIKIRLQN